MQARESRAVPKRQSLDMIDIRRNPYLLDYEKQKRLRKAANEGFGRSGSAVGGRSRRSVEVIDVRNRKSSGAGSARPQRSLDLIETGRQPRTVSAGRKRNAAAARKRCRKQMLQRKITVAAGVLCIFMVGWLILLKKGNASELDQNNGSQEAQMEESQNTSSVIVQGISSKQFAKHPSWTEDFLPVNEFSRPGETLTEVRDIFVHYTANPGTSAAQNRSYFEQQKDMHEASVSAHFIIGYEGEIIQCVPLDEIAYAVQTRNYDSISVECCYKASDGSFTQETYDSLISLLAWLTDTYDLDTSHILRHYDCGGKKCPLYYTEHEDAWAQLKEDVAAGQAE